MIIVAVVLAVLAPIFARLLQLSISRQREYLADATAVKFTRNPKGLADALQKISGDREVLEVANRATAHLYIVNPIKRFEKRAKGLFSTHPPIEERIQILRSLETGGIPETVG
jgi:heat shock protein HtpX